MKSFEQINKEYFRARDKIENRIYFSYVLLMVLLITCAATILVATVSADTTCATATNIVAAL